MNLPFGKQERIRDGKYLKFQRELPCAYGGKNGPCGGEVCACHIRIGSQSGTGQKPSDNRCIPMCATHHRLQHDKGEMWFFAGDLYNVVRLAGRLYNLYTTMVGNHFEAVRDASEMVETFIREERK